MRLDGYLIEIDKAEAADQGVNAARERFYEASRNLAKETKERIKYAEQGEGDFTVYDLNYAARFSCVCGAGMAYPDGIGMHGSWHCSAILLGVASRDVEHTPAHPFAFYEVKSETQNSQGGATTRPAGTHVEITPFYACKKCKHAGQWASHRPEVRDHSEWRCENCGAGYLAEGHSYLSGDLTTRHLHTVVADEVVEAKAA